MTPLLCILTAGADRMAGLDPHGWLLSLISISVVFTALLILYGVYQLIGDINTGKYKRHRKGKAADGEVAAAIALALREETAGADEVAIALALHLYLAGQVHDIEPGIITIRRRESAWDDKKLNFRKHARI